eukprot:7391878-Prymnesium_polylepis.1
MQGILFTECYFAMFMYIAFSAVQWPTVLSLPPTIFGVEALTFCALALGGIEALLLFVAPEHLAIMSPLGLFGVAAVYVVNIAVAFTSADLPVSDGDACPSVGVWEVRWAAATQSCRCRQPHAALAPRERCPRPHRSLAPAPAAAARAHTARSLPLPPPPPAPTPLARSRSRRRRHSSGRRGTKASRR